MRSPLLNQLRALERKRDEIVSQIGGQSQVESQPLKEVMIYSLPVQSSLACCAHAGEDSQ